MFKLNFMVLFLKLYHHARSIGVDHHNINENTSNNKLYLDRFHVQ